MSLDYGLVSKRKPGISEAELKEKLAGKYKITKLTLSFSGEEVLDFMVKPIDPVRAGLVGEVEFYENTDRILSTSTYDYEPEKYKAYIEMLVEVAKLLGLGISDRQTSTVFEDPEEFLKQDLEEIRSAQANTVDNLDDILKQAGILQEGDERVV